MNSFIILDFILFFIFGIMLYNIFIPVLREIRFGQEIRIEGPKSHYKKEGTPTMGGILILFCFLIFFTMLLIGYRSLFSFSFKEILIMIIPIIGFAGIGLTDDLLIVVKRNNNGINPALKFLIQILISAVCYFLLLSIDNDAYFNFFGIKVNLIFGYGVLIVLLFATFTNGTNLTDGVDGLLGGCAIISFLGLGILAIKKGNGFAIVFAFAMIMSLLVFLIFNVPKASIFMGNVGSYLIGAGLVILSISLKVEVLLIFFGFVYLLEIISVILQVWFFKRTKGKRIFRMSPFHHHLELSGYTNWEINLTFYGLCFIMSSIGVLIGVYIC